MHTFPVSPPLIGLVGFFLLLFVALVILGKVPLKYNLRNLVVRWHITFLTGLVFVLVAALLTVMMAFVNGMYRLTEGSARPGNVVVLSDGATDEMFSTLGFRDTSDLERDPPNILNNEEGRPLASWELYLVVNQPVPAWFRLTDEVLTSLRAAKVPEAVLAKLKNLKDRNLDKLPREQFLSELTKILDKDELGHFQNLVVNQALDPASSPVYKAGRRRRFLQLRGIDDPVLSARVHGLELHPGGSWFSGSGVRDDPDGGKDKVIEALLGEGIARELGADVGKPSLAVGDTFELGPRRWVVSGILTTGGTTFDSEIWAKRQIAGPMFGKESSYTTLVLRTAGADQAQETAAWVTANYKKSAVQAQTEPEYYDKLNGTNQQFLGVFVVVMVFMAVGGVFGVMTTMFAAISQRIKDIGVLRILGFAPWQVLLSFFLETLLIAAVGGLIGLAVGSLAHGWSMTSIAGSGQGGGKSVVFKLTVDANICLLVLAFSVAMGILGGLLPALSAMRQRALESLR